MYELQPLQWDTAKNPERILDEVFEAIQSRIEYIEATEPYVRCSPWLGSEERATHLQYLAQKRVQWENLKPYSMLIIDNKAYRDILDASIPDPSSLHWKILRQMPMEDLRLFGRPLKMVRRQVAPDVMGRVTLL